MNSRKIVFLVVFLLLLLTLTFTFQALAVDKAYLLFEEGEVKAGEQTSLKLTLEEAPKGMQRFDIQIKLDKPGVAVIESAQCEALPQSYCQIKKLSSESIQIKGLDIEDTIKAGAKDLVLASLTFEGVSPGEVGITITVNNFFNDQSEWVEPLLTHGSLTVVGAEPEPKPPVAKADGPYSCTTEEFVKLDGSESLDEDGSIQSWKWALDGKQGAGETVQFDCSTLAPGEYKVTLTVTDNHGLSHSDNTSLTIEKKPVEEEVEKPEEKKKKEEPEEEEEEEQEEKEEEETEEIVTEKEIEWKVISLQQRKLHEKKEVKLGLFISNLPDGFRRADIEISLTEPEVARLVGLESAVVDNKFLEVVKSSANLFQFRIVDVLDQISGEVKNLKLADILLEGIAAGQTRVGIGVRIFTDDKGIEVTDFYTRPGWLEIRIVIIGDSKAPPQDLDNDGLYEDINGDGKLNNHDLVLFGFYYDKPVVIENADMFDFSGDGQISFADVRSLHELLEAKS